MQEIRYLYCHLFVVDDLSHLQIINKALDANKITNAWYDEYKTSNKGVIITFVGIVRDEDGIKGLSFDIYEPILNKWFNAWQEKAKQNDAIILMAHSKIKLNI